MTDDVNGFSVKVPVGYTRIRDSAMLQSMTADASVDPADQKLKARLVEYRSTVERARVFAFKRGADFNDYFNVLVASADGVTAENVDDLYGGRISGTKAIRVEYRTHAGPIPLRGTQVFVIHNGVVLAMTINQNDVQTHTAQADTIINSLRLH